jgi:hypothetical protein
VSLFPRSTADFLNGIYSNPMDLIQISGVEHDLIRVFPERNKWTPEDDWAFVGFPPFFRPGTPDTPVHISVTFTWHRKLAQQLAGSWRMYYKNVRIGGPAYDDEGGEFIPGRYMKKGCTITSRGCPKRCGWCKVPFSEGPLREMSTIPAGWIIQDNNILACSEGHLEKVFAMLREQKRNVSFNGGLDKHYLKPWHVKLFESVPVDELWFACDQTKDFPALEKARELLDGFPMRKRRCYTMIGYDDETLAQAERRIERVFELGFMPFSQLYQPPTFDMPTKIYGLDWKAVNRKWSRPAAYMKTVAG